MPICTIHDDFTRNATHKLALCWWYSPGTPVSFTAKTGHHDIAEPVVRNPRINKEIVVYSILFLCYLFQAMSKLVQTEWARFQTENNLPPTKMTASRHRKLAVTTIRDAGASREEQTLLARHMAHSVETADRYYDRSRQTKGRHAVLDIIQKEYKVS